MIFNSFSKRSISDQVGVTDFNFNITMPNTTGACNFGLSGSQVFQFNLKNGKIYDPSGYFVNDYQVNNLTNISGQVGSGVYDYYINGELIALGNPWPTGKYSWIFINPSGMTADFTASIKGKLPNYNLPPADIYRYQNYTISGKIINNNPGINFRIFNAQILDTTSPFSIQSFTTGNISNTGYLVVSSTELGLNDNVLPISLDTNFGNVQFPWTITGDYGIVPDLFLTVSPNETIIIDGVTKNFTTQYSNLPSGGKLGFYLSYYSGYTGNVYYFTGASKLVSGALSGVITGRAQLSQNISGVVSGIDIKTLINESGAGSGILSTDYLVPTGNFSFNYNIPVTGLGNGSIQLNYLASGIVTGSYSGIVSITGSFLQSLAYNFTGYGNNPIVTSGIITIGTGTIIVYPTGCLGINSGLLINTDYYQANLALSKVFSGIISYNFNTLGVGFATGGKVSGIVRTDFAKNFEPGYYQFSKYFSGNASGNMLNTGAFDPMSCSIAGLTSGQLVGTYSYSADLTCSQRLALPDIQIIGLPAQVYDGNQIVQNPNYVIGIAVTGISYIETSDSVISGNYTRTKISRNGPTASGTGIFSNPIRDCGLPLQGFWKESLGSSNVISGISGYIDNVADNNFSKLSTYFGITGSGYYDEVSDNFILQDSGFINFRIRGTGAKHILFKGLNFDSETTRQIDMRLFKNGIDMYGSFNGINNTTLSRADSNLVGVNYYDTFFELTNLTSGFYSLMVTIQESDFPVIAFSQPFYSGCEDSKYIIATVNLVTGVLKQAVYFETDYTDGTARSGVNYQPINFKYLNSFDQAITPYTYSGAFLEPGMESFSWAIPVYDNASFGYNHLFDLTIKNPSGCKINGDNSYTQTVNVIILENETGMVTGDPNFTGVFYPPYICVQPTLPAPPPNPCSTYPPLPGCGFNDPNPPKGPSTGCYNTNCCKCHAYKSITGLCYGFPISGQVVSGICDSITVQGTLGNSGTCSGNKGLFTYVGQLCSVDGCSYKDNFNRTETKTCYYNVRSFNDCCSQYYFPNGLQIGQCYDISTVACSNYAKKGSNKPCSRPSGPTCKTTDVFLQVICQNSWTWSGWTSPCHTDKLNCQHQPIF